MVSTGRTHRVLSLKTIRSEDVAFTYAIVARDSCHFSYYKGSFWAPRYLHKNETKSKGNIQTTNLRAGSNFPRVVATSKASELGSLPSPSLSKKQTKRHKHHTPYFILRYTKDVLRFPNKNNSAGGRERETECETKHQQTTWQETGDQQMRKDRGERDLIGERNKGVKVEIKKKKKTVAPPLPF